MGELWVAGPDSLVDVDGARVTLDAVAARLGAPFVGRRAFARLGARFPLLVKLIDAADWLSLQVHPDDALAAELAGPGSVGKTEAWLVLDAAPGAELVTGPRAGLDADALRAAIAAGTVGLAHCERRPARVGETLLVRAGTMHAIGAGTLVYEIEQPSDITYRMSDWGRPTAPGRRLHVQESLRAIDPAAHAEQAGVDFALHGGALATPELRLELGSGAAPWTRTPAGESVEVVTVVAGEAEVSGDGWRHRLDRFGTVVVPSSVDAYEVRGTPDAISCVGSIP